MRFPAVAVKIWLIFSLTLLIFSMIQSVLMIISFSDYTESQLLKEFAASSGMIIWSRSSGMKKETVEQLEELYFPEPLINQILIQAEEQEEPEKTYSWKSEYEDIIYSIEIVMNENDVIYTMTYMWNTLVLSTDLILDGLKTSLYMLIFMLFPAYLVARNLVKPLLRLETHALRIAERDLSVPIEIRRKDEIGALEKSLEQMRVQLKEQDESQKRLFQAVSHELKTPVMVIRSYVQAIEDGVGEQSNNLKVIDSETILLEQKISKLISLAKIGYLSSQEGKMAPQDLSLLLDEIIERLKLRRSDLKWQTDLDEVYFAGNIDILNVLFENILDNQIRYGEKEIRISLKTTEGRIYIEIENDGPPVQDELLEKIFEIFFKGEKGGSGLGLSIVREICHHYGGDISAQNKFDRTVFKIDLPASHNFT